MNILISQHQKRSTLFVSSGKDYLCREKHILTKSSLYFDMGQILGQKNILSQDILFLTFDHQELIIGLYSINLYKKKIGPPLSTGFLRFSKCTVTGCYLEGTLKIVDCHRVLFRRHFLNILKLL